MSIEPPPIAAPDWWAQACEHLAREDRVMRRLIARHEAFGRSRAEAAHWVRVMDVPNDELVAATSARCDEL